MVPLLSLMAGVFVLIAGVLKIGRVVSYIPWPVIEGFTLGIAVIIFLQQVPAALGVSPGPSSNTLVAVIEALPAVTWPESAWAIAATIAVAVIMVLLPRLNRHIPASLIAIIVVTVVVVVANIPIARIGELPSALPAPTFPAGQSSVAGDLGRPGTHDRGPRGDRVAAVRAGCRIDLGHRPVRRRPGARRAGSRIRRVGPVRGDAGDRGDRAHRGESPLGRPKPARRRASTPSS